MKKLFASGVAMLLFSGLAQAQPQAAFQFGQVLGQSFCEGAKTIYANGVVPQPHMDTSVIENAQDVLICKNALVQSVRSDGFCYNAYYGNVGGMTRDSFERIRSLYEEYVHYCNTF